VTDLAIVTAADSSHAGPLGNLLFSIALFEPFARVIVYDLGLEGHEVKALEAPEIRRFPFERYPAHVAMAARSYAW